MQTAGHCAMIGKALPWQLIRVQSVDLSPGSAATAGRLGAPGPAAGRCQESRCAVELGVGEKVAKRLRRELGVTRSRATPRVAAAAGRGRARQAALAAERRQARLAELGFDDVRGYLGDRVGGRGWSQRRVVAELRVGKEWLRREAAGLGLAWSAPP
jgi:hypothetical protein